MKLFILLLIGLVACKGETPVEKRIRKQNEGVSKAYTVEYYKDSRTNLCFAFAWGGGTYISSGNGWTGGPVYTNVPCTPEVEKLVTFAPSFLQSTE